MKRILALPCALVCAAMLSAAVTAPAAPAAQPQASGTVVTFWDKPGVHIFMTINGRDFGTSDGGAGNPSQRKGGAGWLDDGAPDALNRAFKPYHLAASELSASVVYGPTLTFQTGRAYDLLQGLVVGDNVHVSYTRDRKGVLTAGEVTPAQITAVSPPST